MSISSIDSTCPAQDPPIARTGQARSGTESVQLPSNNMELQLLSTPYSYSMSQTLRELLNPR